MMIVKEDIPRFSDPSRILLRAEDFIYILPHPALGGQISNYTLTFPNQDIISPRYTVLPHGSATLVFSWDGGRLSGTLFGPLTKPCEVGGLANQSDRLFIVEFQPAGLFAFVGVPQKELANQTVSFELINAALNRLILELLERSHSLDELVARLDRLLLEHLHIPSPSALGLATTMIVDRGGTLSCKDISSRVYYSQRHLNRIFEHYVGMNTKTFSRLVRINRAIRRLQAPQSSLTQAFYETGFYDLPHFIHDFKSVCGLTPQEYRENMSDFYSEIAKF